MSGYKPRYSGPDRSGVCVCGHRWEEHHLSLVMNPDYIKQTGESHLPEECEVFGFNETGGLIYVEDRWEHHCHRYRDSKETER
jgi:hypothetical protein